MDCLGVSDPQAFFLYDRINTRMPPCPVGRRKEQYPKGPVPASYGTMLFQKPLLDDPRPFALPPP